MLKNNFLIAFRKIWKNRGFAFINVLGLAIGISSALVILTYIREELSYDRFHEDHDKIFRVTVEYFDDARQLKSAINFSPLVDILSEHMPGIKHAVRIMPYPAYVSADKINKYRESRLVFADSTLFNVFSFKGIGRNLENVLEAPFAAVITHSTAMKYFGTIDVVGRELYYEDERRSQPFFITAVMEDVPQNSHFHFDIAFSLASLKTLMPWYNNWHHPPMYIYLETENNYAENLLAEKIQSLADIHQPDYVNEENRVYDVQSIASIHLNSSLSQEWETNSEMIYIKMFAGVAAFLLLIACINFMNLTTAQAAQRAKEVGVRKVIGAYRNQLARQFLGEAFVISVVSLILALGITELMLMTFFKAQTGKQLSLLFLFQGINIGWLVLLLAIITVLAGSYPAFYLSGFRAVLTLKGKTEESGSVLGLRRGLVVFQFFISGFLILATLVISRQVEFLRNKNLGFNKDQVIAIKMVDHYASGNYKVLKDELLKDSRVSSVGMSSEVPGGFDFYGWQINPEGFDRNTLTMKSLGVDEDFLSTYRIEFINGRGFSIEFPSDETKAVVLNETAVKILGWTPESAIGKNFEFTIYTGKEEIRKATVIGVVKDFHYESLYQQIEPLMIFVNKHMHFSDYLSVRLREGNNLPDAIEMINAKWKAFHPEKPVEFQILDDQLRRKYDAEMKIGTIFSSFSALSIIISCLGLFGLSAFSAQRRTKEIGIRKVLGATTTQITGLLSKEYIIIVLAANALSMPLAFYFVNQWLDNFPYHTNVDLSLGFLTLVLALIIAIVTVSFQAIKAAMINPVKSLKEE